MAAAMQRSTTTALRRCAALALAIAIAAGSAAAAPRGDGTPALADWSRALAARGIDPDRVPDPFAIDDTMRATAIAVAGEGSARQRLTRLQAFLFDPGEFEFRYEQRDTRTASEAFHARAGNCVAFTNLFIALGRAAGIPLSAGVRYRRSGGEIEGSLVVLHNHVVAVFRDDVGMTIYDFNRQASGPILGFEVVDDLSAAGLYVNNLAVDALRAGDLAEARRLLETVVRLAPRFAAGYANLGVVRRRSGDVAGALEAYACASALGSHMPVPGLRANLSALLGEIVKRRLERGGWTRSDVPTDSLEGRMLHGDMALSIGNFRRARVWYRRASKLDPSVAAPWVSLARLRMLNGKPGAARRALEQALARAPDDRGARAIEAVLDRIDRAR